MGKQQSEILSLPAHPARLILERDYVLTRRLLGIHDFTKYCKERGLDVSVERLNQFERLRVFPPIVRFFRQDESNEHLRFPGSAAAEWFNGGQAVDASTMGADYAVPGHKDKGSAPYYSIFQLDHLDLVLASMTVHVHLDPYVDAEGDRDWNSAAAKWVEFVRLQAESWRTHEFRRAIAVLCQCISNCYYPYSQSNQRTIKISNGSSLDAWISIETSNWDWHDYCQTFDPQEIASLFRLTPDKLTHAYSALAGSIAGCDPLEEWSNLVEFVAVEKKKALRGSALRAQSYRDAAHMLRRLHKDLYGDDLAPPHEVFGTVITHFPELDVRVDTRRHLEFIVNQFDLNPRPKLVLFVEGESEVVLVGAIFRVFLGIHPGVLGIEIVNLQGVNNATGGKKVDRFQAIFRLVDYLHHHQSLTFLILDRENNAEKLKAAAKKARSIFGQGRFATPARHIKLWKVSLEFDNFSDTELATAMCELAAAPKLFRTADVRQARNGPDPGRALSVLYEARTHYGLKKPALAEKLAEVLLAPRSRRRPERRPLVKLLVAIEALAARNPFPLRDDDWRRNQSSSFFG